MTAAFVSQNGGGYQRDFVRFDYLKLGTDWRLVCLSVQQYRYRRATLATKETGQTS